MSVRFIGVDVAKQKLDIWFSNEDQPHQVIPNQPVGFKRLLSRLQPGDIIGVESTGRYHQALARFLLAQGYTVRLLNPLLTKQFTRATIRNKKTDKTDAEIITKLLMQGEGYDLTLSELDNPLRTLTRFRRGLVKQRSKLKTQLSELSHDPLSDLMSQHLQSIINTFDQHITQLDQQLQEHQSDQITILESVPGISAVLAREVLAELGNLQRFDRKQQLVAYAGYDPKIKRSGSSLNHTGSLTKRGSPFLRNALFLAVFANLRSHNVFSRYYRKKRSQGKAHTQAMVATSRKMLEIIFALLNKHQKFSLVFS